MKIDKLNYPGIVKLFSLICFANLLLCQCKQEVGRPLKQETGTIDGKILHYDGVFKSGKLSYFDAISRTTRNEIFPIDSTGKFKMTFKLSHPVYNTAYFDIQGHYFTTFLEPGKNLQIQIDDNSIDYLDESGQSNIQINLIEDSIDSKFKEEIKRSNFLHTTNIGYKDYVKEQINLSNKILSFLKEFAKNKNFDKDVLNAISKETYYAPAKFWINFRFDYKDGPPKKRDTLFKNFYEDLFKKYPLNDPEAMVSRNYIDYISNIKDVLSEQEPTDSIYNYFKRSNSFDSEGLALIKRAYDGDKSVFTSEEFKQFYNDLNRKKLSELGNRYRVNKLLLESKGLPKGIGRDLVISQGICSFYFEKSYVHPTEDEWINIKEVVETKSILEYLLDLDNRIAIDLPKDESQQAIPETVKILATNLNNELIGKYKGKVIYIDFWATWCSPCRQEIPFTKVLAEQFKNKDVVFLSLCCKSDEKNWQNTIEHEEMPGDHYFVKDIDFDLLSSIYRVNGFPTYILIDKNGEVKNYNASRPSSNSIIINDIQTLLD